MSQLVACPECKKHLQVPDELMGKKVQCPECKNTFTAKEPDEEEVKSKVSTTPAVPPSKKKPQWDKEEDDDDRPSKSTKKRKRDDDYDVSDRDDDDDDDERPRSTRRRRSSGRGNYAAHRGGMIMAFGLIGLITGIVVLSIIAWVMGNADLEEMRQGRMDPEGEGMTQAGKIMGMIAVILWIVAIVVSCGFVGCIVLIPMMMIGGVAAGGAAGAPRR